MREGSTQAQRRCTSVLTTLAALLLAVGTLGCISVQHHHEPDVVVVKKHGKKGPPPWAPAHGWRRKHGDAELHYRSDLGAYVVVGWDRHYYCDDVYYRFDDAHWWRSPSLRGPWVIVKSHHVPPGLVKVAVHRPKKKHR